MADMDEVLMEATEKCMLKQFTTAKPAVAVAGDDVPIDDFVGADMASFDPAVIDEVLQEAKLPAAVDQGAVHASSAAAAGGRGGRKHRLSKAEIRTILFLTPRPLPATDDLDDLTDIFSPEYIKERKQLLEADAQLFRKTDEESELFRQRLIKSVRENGYFEVDDEYLVNQEKANQYALEQWAGVDLSGLHFATEAEDAEMEADYFPDEEAAAVLELLSSDDEEGDLSSDDEEDDLSVEAATEAN